MGCSHASRSQCSGFKNFFGTGREFAKVEHATNGVAGGLDSIINKVQESEEVILSRLRDFPLISSRRRVVCGYHLFY